MSQPRHRSPAPAAALLTLSVVAAACGAAATTTTSPSAPVARVNSVVITESQFDLRLQATLTNLAAAGASTANAQMVGRVRGSIVRGLIFDTVIAEEAARLQVAPSAADVDAQLAQAASDAGGRSQLQTQLAAAGQSINSLRDEIRARLTEQRLEDFFARDRIAAVVQALAQGGDFGRLVSQYSDSPDTAPKGGRLGTLGDDQIRALLGDTVLTAVRSLKPGQATPPVRTRSGYEVVRLDGITASGRTLREILVAAPDPYTVRERPNWFSELVFAAILDDCKNAGITVFVADPGANPCANPGPSSSPGPSPTP